MKKLLVFLMCFALSTGLLFSQNIVTDGGFEESTPNEVPSPPWEVFLEEGEGLEVADYFVVEALFQGHDGSQNNLKITTTSGTPICGQDIAVEPSTNYELSCFMKSAETLSDAGLSVWSPTGIDQYVEMIGGDDTWKKYSLEFTTSALDDTIWIDVASWSGVDGDVFKIDDIAVTKLGEVGISSGFEDQTGDTLTYPPFSGRLEEAEGNVWDYLTVENNGNARTGEKNLKLTTLEDAGVFFGADFLVEPSTSYELSLWVNIPDSLVANWEDEPEPAAWIDFEGGYADIPMITDGWEEITVEFTTPADSTEGWFEMGVWDDNAGVEFRVDDIHLEEMEAPPAPPFSDGGFEDQETLGEESEPWYALGEETSGEITDYAELENNDNAHTGDKNLLITSAADAGVLIKQDFSLDPETDYVMNVWMQSTDSLLAWEEPCVWFGAGGGGAEFGWLDFVGGSEDWQKLVLEFTSPENADNCWIEMGIWDDEAGMELRVDDISIEKATGIDANLNVPAKFSLQQNYPNPFNPSTKINFNIPKNELVTMTVYNIMGQKVQTLLSQKMHSGKHSVEWNGRNTRGNLVPSGIYFYRLESGNHIDTKKMMLMH